MSESEFNNLMHMTIRRFIRSNYYTKMAINYLAEKLKENLEKENDIIDLTKQKLIPELNIET